jgi:hypothetical protein
VNPRRTPELVLGGHLADQSLALGLDAGPARTSRATAPPNEPIAMPAVNGCRLDQHPRISPVRPHPSQDQPQQAVRGAKAPIGTSEHPQLVAQSKNLEQQVSTLGQGVSDPSDRAHDATHRA